MPDPAVSHAADSAPLSFSEAELQAYVQGHLSAQRRTQIAGFLACNPDLAARVMGAMHAQGRVRAIAADGAASAVRRHRSARLALACGACVLAGWAVAAGLDDDGPLQGLITAPEYVGDAVMSWRATHVRLGIDGHMHRSQLGAQQLEQSLQIDLPVLPEEWRLVDVQVYPSEMGPGISMLLEPAAGRQVNLFAVRANTAASDRPTVAARHGAHAAYWETGGTAFVLTGEGSSVEMLADATRLSTQARP